MRSEMKPVTLRGRAGTTGRASRRGTTGRVLLAVLLAAVAAQTAAPASAGFNDRDTCRVVHSGKSGPKGDFVVVHRTNGYAGATVLYRDRHRIRFFTSEGIPRHEGWRSRTSEIGCGPVAVRDIDRIVIRMKPRARRALVIDQSGRGLRSAPHRPSELRGPGGPFAPGASGRGIRVEFANRPRSPSYLIYAGSDRSERVYVSRDSGLISLRARSAAGRPLGRLVGFNGRQVVLSLGGGDDLMEASGLGPDPSDYGDFYFQAFGGKGDDRLLGHEGRDLNFEGGAGDDLIRGRGGDDRDTGSGYGLKGGSGDDTIFGGAGDDWIEGDSGRDDVLPGPGEDVIFMDDGERDVVDCESDSLDYVVFDESLDQLIGCFDVYPA